jgi:predicted amidophosphoribosyltransferase
MEKFDSVCIYCGEPLSKWESTRSYCWNCNELTSSEAFHEDDDNKD